MLLLSKWKAVCYKTDFVKLVYLEPCVQVEYTINSYSSKKLINNNKRRTSYLVDQSILPPKNKLLTIPRAIPNNYKTN